MALYATNRFPGDGTTTSYEFNFVGKYIARTHVKVYQEDNATKVRTYVSINDSNFLNDTTLRSLPVTPVGQTLVIYRDTPKPPIVDFVNGSRFTEYNLDLVTRQGLFVAMEALDAGGSEARQQLVDAIVAAASARDAAVAAKNAAEAALDSFDDRYLGAKSVAPTTDNYGGALLTGALYFRTTAPIGMKVWTGTAWDDAYANLSSKFDKTGGDVNGNINFTGIGRRITGDFSNGTIASRVMFQTSTVNGNTVVSTLPNGSSTTSGFRAYGSDNLLNGVSADLVASIASGDVRLISNAYGTGTYLPLAFHTGGSERMRIDTSGNVLATSGALGYGVGAGGTVMQPTAKTADAVLNKPSGRITTHNSPLNANTSALFIFRNSFLSPGDGMILSIATGAQYGSYTVGVADIQAGLAVIALRNISGASLSEYVGINFQIIKGATS